jgi:hypothetical protein
MCPGGKYRPLAEAAEPHWKMLLWCW